MDCGFDRPRLEILNSERSFCLECIIRDWNVGTACVHACAVYCSPPPNDPGEIGE